MTRKIKDTDYLYISARLKVLEKQMLGKTALSRIAAADSEADALKILSEYGWPEIEPSNSRSLDHAISEKRQEALDLLYRYSPDSRVIDIFRLKYDYHNIKTYVKGEAKGVPYEHLLTDAAAIAPQKLVTALREQRAEGLDPIMYSAAEKARDTLLKTKDPQLSDVILDYAMAEQMSETAKATRSKFLQDYVKLYIDGINLKVACRGYLTGKGPDYLEKALAPFGSVPVKSLIRDNGPAEIEKLFGSGPLSAAVKYAVAALKDKTPLDELDKACDNALLEYLRSSRFVPFGEAQVITYLLLLENELTCVRIVLAGRAAGYSEDKIMEKLRLGYYV